MNVSHTAEIRFYDLDDESAARLMGHVIRAYGTAQVDVRYGTVGAQIEWPSRQTDEDKPSSKQVNYARRLWYDLKDLIRSEKDLDLAEQAQSMLTAISAVMKDSEVRKTDASDVITALKDAIAELQFSQTGAVDDPWA